MEQAMYSQIPMRTWRWLGVNGKPLPQGVGEEIKKDVLQIATGEEKQAVIVYRGERRAEVNIELAAEAKLNLTVVQLVPDDMPHAGEIHARLAKGADLQATIIEAGSKESVSKLLVELEGDEATTDIAALYFGDKKRSHDLNYVIRQQGKATNATMNVKGALMDQAEKTFRGTLDFIQGAKGSVGHEDETVILLSSKVRNRSIPLMLSGEGDVDGHHAVSIGKMDEAKLFYLMSRGLNLKEARRLVVEAAFHPVINRIPNEALRAETQDHIERRIDDVD